MYMKDMPFSLADSDKYPFTILPLGTIMLGLR